MGGPHGTQDLVGTESDEKAKVHSTLWWRATLWALIAAVVVVPLAKDAVSNGVSLVLLIPFASGLLIWLLVMLSRSGIIIVDPENPRMNFLRIAIPAVDNFFKSVERDKEILAKNIELVGGFEGTLRAYGIRGLRLTKNERLSSALKRVGGKRPDALTPKSCADAVAETLLKNPECGLPAGLASCDSEQLALGVTMLYGDYVSDRRLTGWPQSVDRDTLGETLALIILQHPRFAAFAAGEREAAVAITKLDPFALDQLPAELQQPRAVVDNMVQLLSHYHLGTVSVDDQDRIAADLSGTPFVDLPEECGFRFSALLDGTPPGEPSTKADVLALLYRAHFNRPTFRNWARRTDELVNALADALCRSNTLGMRFPFDARSAARVIGRLEDFDIALVRDIARRLGDLWTIVDRYRRDLNRQGVSARIDPYTFLVGLDLPSDRSTFAEFMARCQDVDALLLVGEQAMSGLMPITAGGSRNADDELELRALCLVSIGWSLPEESGDGAPLTSDVSRRAGTGPSAGTVAEMLLGYLWHTSRSSEGPSQLPSGLLPNLVNKWRNWCDGARREFGESDFAAVRAALLSALRRGNWPTRLPLQERDPVGFDISRLEALVARMEPVATSRARALQLLHDLAGSGVYVLTFDANEGPLALLIDHLTERIPEKRIVDGVAYENYDFEHYTRYARIGDIPARMTFQGFFERFSLDFEQVLTRRKDIVTDDDYWKEHDLREIEITMQLIALPMRYNFDSDVLEPQDPPDQEGKWQWLKEPSILRFTHPDPASASHRVESSPLGQDRDIA